jgi:site-specific recombinase XerD
MLISDAARRFLDGHKKVKGTHDEYSRTLRRVHAIVDPAGDRPLSAATGDEYADALSQLWGDKADSTWNARRGTVNAFLKWCARGRYTDIALPHWCENRNVKIDRTKVVPASDISILWSDQIPLRERALWRCLYESASRATAMLSADIPNIVAKKKRIRVVQKGGDTVWLHLEDHGFDLLNQYLAGRTTGPIWITNRRPWNWRTRPPGDVAPDGRSYRLSYQQARKILNETSARYGIEGTEDLEFHFVNLHQMARKSRLTHLAEEGWDTPVLRAVSNHQSAATLHNNYTHVTPDSIERLFRSRNPAKDDT